MSYPQDMHDIAKNRWEESKRWFPGVHETKEVAGEWNAIMHFTLGLSGEVGEIANLIKKVNRGDRSLTDIHDDLADEIADVLIYLMNLAIQCDIDIDNAMWTKRGKLFKRWGNPYGE